MAGEWKETTLGAIAARSGYGLVDGPFGSNLPASCYTETGIPVIRGSNLTTGVARFRADEFVYVSQETANENERSLCRPGDIVFTKKGTIGQTGFVPDGGKHCLYLLSSNQMKLTVELSVADPLFVYYFVSAPSSVEKIIRDSEATGVPKTNLAYLREFPISLPPLAEQKAIAAVLGALDDKIELNRRMNATLEAMARTLFQSWFVDFDPVRAKLDVRKPDGLDKPTAGLFPSELHETELGQIPRAWQVGCLGDLCTLKRGHDLPTATRTAGPIPVISSSGVSGTHSETNVRGPGVVTGRYGTIGKVFFVETDYWPLNTTLYVEDFKGSPPRFIFHVLGEVDFSNYTDKAAVPGVNRNHLHQEPTVIPPVDIRHAFAHIVAPLWSRHAANERESRTLASLRDTLLPKLLSGELSVQ